MLSSRRQQSLVAWLAPTIIILALLPGQSFGGNDTDFTYLALGDSVAFGLDVTKLVPNQPPPSPDVFIGYPEKVAAAEHLAHSKKEVNTSCPGETSGSFISGVGPDYGCHDLGPQGQPPFKTSVGLHTNYSGSQLAFAVSQLSTNKHINLVTLGIGSNDALIVLRDCAGVPACVNARLPGVLREAYAQNLRQILTAIRGQYTGTLILVKYYSPSPGLNPIAQAVNATMTAVGSQFNVRFADGYAAFQLASALFGGDPCAAGLVIRLSPTTCDIHPSPIGRDILAATVELALNP